MTSRHFPEANFIIFSYRLKFCGTVCFGELASANVVGYADKASENYTFIGPVFTQVGGSEAFTYGDIKVNCDETGEGDGSGWQPLADSIVVLDENGTYVRKLVYAPQYIADAYQCTKGWYDADAASEENYTDCWNNKITYAPGEGFQMSAAASMGATVTINSALSSAE